ncbi:MAG: 2-dehydropantoate 2-reductase N-terminal domain-containing protein [Paenibacillus macerans]|uniref:Ketopantoate reductase PanE/ApbA family protein n=1 Tax=Paenibacillus macerans TaxID=44252 RepID=A0A090ZAQ8_PAEMA|nr:2-dehydropantoate 2-reductase N-terminal domain-containing protein [Paenibacillus macerans]KFN08364.1 ketopantoate reductase PanE/ApbA family protein [Paenibacillus macerans]MCY7557132.1 ketopantoate reductase family protein [Paenibacillus macerans]MDU7473535.1 2-dehydropantoate 2-reductase N-terminal domain-containing protein [Paenibacillus macerans]MEC0135419.1 2-dehydropantoate 2-reductase N-terminal domain-containing protein [Paenibacillus macerans]MEC0152475.1 2-dehydropantoate 2-reduc
MDTKQNRLLIFGAGVIGSVYSLRFAQSGLDVTLLARGKRLESLKRNGLRYNDNGTIKQTSVKTIEKLENEDIYDFIFVPVRYDQAESALTAIKNNQSKTIVTLTNTIGYDTWLEIVGDRLLPGFPGAGGDIKEDVLYAEFGSEKHQGTIFGEIHGQTTERLKELAKILEAADLHYEIQNNIQAFHVSHAALAIVNKHFYTNDGMVDIETARSESTLSKVAADIKQNIRLVEQAGIPVIPPEMKVMGEWPESDIISSYRQMLSNDFIIDVKLGNHAVSQKAEILLLDELFHKKLSLASDNQHERR